MILNLENLKSELKDYILQYTGNVQIEINKIAPIHLADESSVSFVANAKYLDAAKSSKAKLIICNEKIFSALNQDEQDKAPFSQNKQYIISNTPELCLAKISRLYFARNVFSIERTDRIAKTAIIDPSAKIAEDCVIEANVVIGKNVSIGSKSFIGANTVIADNVQIKENCQIYSHVYIGANCKIANSVWIQSMSSLGDATSIDCKIEIDDEVEIGSNVCIHSGNLRSTKISKGTKLDNKVLVDSDVHIGRQCLITAGCMFLNHSTVGDACVFGGNSTVAANIKTTAQCQFAGISYVDIDITEPGAYGGHPIQNMKDYLRTTMSLQHLVQMRKDISKLQESLNN